MFACVDVCEYGWVGVKVRGVEAETLNGSCSWECVHVRRIPHLVNEECLWLQESVMIRAKDQRRDASCRDTEERKNRK